MNVFGDDAYVRPAGQHITAPATDLARQWHGWGTALKPAYEPILYAMKPCEGTFAQNAAQYGVAGLWIDGARIGGKPRTTHKDGNYTGNSSASAIFPMPNIRTTEPLGRWPANLLLDEEAAAMLDEQAGERTSGGTPFRRASLGYSGRAKGNPAVAGNNGDRGGASRFFYTAKASRSERGEGNRHPTVKPLAIMRYLCTLTRTPTGGTVLDPFMGSGTTGLACIETERPFIGIEQDEQSCEIAAKRIDAALNRASETAPLLASIQPESREVG